MRASIDLYARAVRLLRNAAFIFLVLISTRTSLNAQECVDYGKHIHWTATFSTLGLSQDVAVTGSRAYLIDWFPTNVRRGLHVLDVSDPSAPIEIGYASTEVFDLTEIAVAGDYAYVAGGSGLIVFDVSWLVSQVVRISLPGGATDVVVDGNYAYLSFGHSGLHIVDISSPASPLLVSTTPTPGEAQGVAVAGNRAYIAVGYEGMQIVDVSDPQAPILLGRVDTPGIARGVAVAGDLVCIADDGRGLVVIDASDPGFPQMIGRGDEPQGPARNVTVSDGHAFLSFGFPGGIQVFDLTVPNPPLLVGEMGFAGAGQGLTVADGVAYVSDSSILGGLQIFEVGEPTSPPRLGGVDMPWLSTGVAVDSRHAYVVSEYGLRVVDVTVPGAPSVIGSTLPDTPATDVVAHDQYVYMTEAYVPPPKGLLGGESHLKIIDISNPQMPVVRSTIPTPYYANRVALAYPYAYVADVGYGLLVIDVSDPDTPWQVGHVGGFTAYDVAVADSFACMAGISFRIFDISDPMAPQILSSLDLPGGRIALSEDEHVVCTADYDTFITIDVRDPLLPVVIGGLRLPPSFEVDIAIHKQVAYVAKEDYGVCVIDITRPAAPRFVGTVSTDGLGFAVAPTDEFLYTSGYFDLEIFPAQCRFPTPVSMGGLEAIPNRDGIRIGWQVHEAVFSTFEIWRAHGSNPSEAMYAALEVKPSIPADGPWEYMDRNVVPGQVYAYKVRALARDGRVEFIGPVFATAMPPHTLLLRAAPNPAPGGTAFLLDLPRSGTPHIRIYDAAGRCVRTLLGEPLIAGSHSVLWDGRDNRQERVASGLYIARLTGGREEAVARITLLR